jgi:hypothetical protein
VCLETDLVLASATRWRKRANWQPSSEIGVEQGFVALPAAPQRVVRAAQPLGDGHHLLDLGGGIGEDLGVRIRRRAGRVPRMAEEVGGTPQEDDPGSLLVGRRFVDDGFQVCARFGEGPALRRNVAVVEAVIRGSFEEL